MVEWLTKLIAKVSVPFNKKRVPGSFYVKVKDEIRPGDVILTYTFGHLSNLFIPGKYKHIGWYVEDGYVFESTSKGNKLTHLSEFLLHRDGAVVLRATFAPSNIMKIAAKEVLEIVGQPYDFSFRFRNKAWYCSEAIYCKTKDILEKNNIKFPFKPKEYWGRKVIAPNDFWKQRDQWGVLAVFPKED